jgi:ferric-chelate reductase
VSTLLLIILSLIYRIINMNTNRTVDYATGHAGLNTPRDVLFVQIIYSSMLAFAGMVLLARVAQIGHIHLRYIVCSGATEKQQSVWNITESSLWVRIKSRLLYAPLLGKRHNREIQLSSAMNMGTLPSRFHLLLIFGYIVSQTVYCLDLNYQNETPAIIAELRGRSGTLATLNMVPLVAFATRNNPLIPLLRISFDSYNLFHRWLGRIAAIESIIHMAAWAVNTAQEADTAGLAQHLAETPSYAWGMVATAVMGFFILHSLSPVRHAFYETFLCIHQVGASFIFLGIYLHLDMHSLPQKPWIQGVFLIWSAERFTRLLWLVFLNVSRRHGMTKLRVEALPGEACRLTFFLPRHYPVPSGSHFYAYIPQISWWMSHPFSAAWTETSNPSPFRPKSTQPSITDIKSLTLESQSSPFNHTAVTLVVAARQGMTRALYARAMSSPDDTFTTTGLLEGPYSSHAVNMASYGTAILFSGGIGITHHLLFIRDLLLRSAAGRAATRSITLVWAVRSLDSVRWVLEYMQEILQMPNAEAILTIMLFVSKPRSPGEMRSPGGVIRTLAGRCNPATVMEEIMPRRIGATVVSVCGPGALGDDVRDAARRQVDRGATVDFVEEAFTW